MMNMQTDNVSAILSYTTDIVEDRYKACIQNRDRTTRKHNIHINTGTYSFAFLPVGQTNHIEDISYLDAIESYDSRISPNIKRINFDQNMELSLYEDHVHNYVYNLPENICSVVAEKQANQNIRKYTFWVIFGKPRSIKLAEVKKFGITQSLDQFKFECFNTDSMQIGTYDVFGVLKEDNETHDIEVYKLTNIVSCTGSDIYLNRDHLFNGNIPFTYNHNDNPVLHNITNGEQMRYIFKYM